MTHLGALPSSEVVEEILFPNENALLVVCSLKFKYSPNITIRLLHFPFHSKALQHEVSCYLIFYLSCSRTQITEMFCGFWSRKLTSFLFEFPNCIRNNRKHVHHLKLKLNKQVKKLNDCTFITGCATYYCLSLVRRNRLHFLAIEK